MQVIDNNPQPGQTSQTPQQGMAGAVQRAAAKLAATMNAPQEPQAAPQAPAQRNRDLPVQDPNKVDPMELSQITNGSPQSQSDTSEVPAPEETAALPKAPSPKEDPALSSRYAQLARREKALRAQAMQLKQEQEAFRASQVRTPEPTPQQTFDPSKYVSLEDLGKDPFAHLAKANLTYEQLVEQALNAPKPDEVKLQQLEARYNAQIKALEEKLEGTNKAIKEQETAAYQGAVNQIRADVKQLINKDPAFETIKITGQEEEVVKLIESVYKDGMGDEYPKGTVLDHYEAAKMVEDEVAESLYGWASKSTKFAQRFKPGQQVAPAAPGQKNSTQQTGPSTQARTLTNQMSSSRQLSARDRAILAAEGKLK